MNKQRKKGIHPHRKENTQAQVNSITLEVICLLNFIAFFCLLVVGKCTGNGFYTALGAGIGFVTLEMTLYMNGGEEHE